MLGNRLRARTCGPSGRRSATPKRRPARSRAVGPPGSSAPGSSTPPTGGSTTVIVVGTGLAGGSAAAALGGAGLPGRGVLLPGQPPARAQHRRAGRHQRRQELPQRRRQRLPAVLRHDQGRRLPLARVERLPARRGQRRHHRPVRRPGRAVRARVRRAARQPLLRRRPGLAHLLRPRPDRPAAAARRLPGAGAAGRSRHRADAHPRTRCSTWSSSTAAPAASSSRDLVTGEIAARSRDAVVLATGGYGNVFYLSTNAMGCNATAIWRAHRRGALFANPCFTQIHPTCIPVSGDHQSKLTLMSESLRNDGRSGCPQAAGDERAPGDDPRARARLLPRAQYPRFGNLVPRDVASRAAKDVCDEGRGVGPGGLGVYLDFADAITRLGRARHRGALRQPVRDVRADHRRGPLPGADAHLPGRPLHDGRALGRLRPAEHDSRAVRHRRGQLLRPRRQPPRRERADAGPRRRLLRPARTPSPTIWRPDRSTSVDADPPRRRRDAPTRVTSGCAPCCRSAASAPSTPSTASSAQLMWDHCGMARTARGPAEARSARSASCAQEFWRDVKVPGERRRAQPAARAAGRVADFLELGELMCLDALHREESCGGHFREEHQTADGEALRDDEHFAYVAAWEYAGRRPAAGPAQGEPDFEYVAARASGATSERLTAPRLAAGAAADSRGHDGRPTWSRTSPRTCPSSRCSTC